MGTGWQTCRFCCPRCKKAVRDAKFSHLAFSPVGRPLLHLGSRNLNVGPQFSPVGRTVYHFTVLLFHFHWVPGRGFFASRVAKPECRTTIFTGRPDRLLSYYFSISFPLGSRQEVFLHLGSRNLNVGPPFSPVGRTVYYFTLLLFHFHWVQGRRFLHLGSRNLNVGPPFSPVGRTVYYSTILLSHFHWVQGRRFFLYLGQHFLHVGSRFCMSAKRIPRQTRAKERI